MTGILQSTAYPRSKALTLLSRESLDKPVVRYEPRHTPPDCFEAQDFALRKAEILLQETQRAMKQSKRAKAAESPRRDSAVSEEEADEVQITVTAAASREESLVTVRPTDQPSLINTKPHQVHATPDLPQVLTTVEPQIIVTTTEPHSPRGDGARESPKRRKLASSPKSHSPAPPAGFRSSNSRAGSESRFAKPRTPSAPATAPPPAPRGESVASVRSTDSKASRHAIKDDLTIDSKFGKEADDSDEAEFLARDGKWYAYTGKEWPGWALETRPKTKIVAAPSRRSTGAWRSKRQ